MLEEYRVTAKYLKDNFPQLFSFAKTLVAILLSELTTYLLSPDSLPVITIGNIFLMAIRVVITAITYQTRIEAKPSKI